MKTLTMILACVLVLAVAGGGVWALDHFKKEPKFVKPEPMIRVVHSQVARKIDRRIDVVTHGTVTPRNEINLVAQVAGQVLSVSASLENGGFFDADEVLVRLDDRDYRLEVTQAESLVAQAELRVTWERAEADVARREWEALGKGQATALTLREPQIKEAEAALASAKASLAKANLSLERATIRAPFAGRVRVKSVDLGQFVTVGTTIARIYAVDFAEVRLPLHDSKLRYLDLPLAAGVLQDKGLTVTLRTRFAQATREWVGTIVRTEGEVDPKSRMVYAIARVADPYGRDGDHQDRTPLSVGMFVEAIIRGRTFENVFEIPRDAVRERGGVLVIDEENQMHERSIRVLYRGEKIVVVDDGLADGDRICLSPIAVFVEGMKVRLAESQDSSKTGKPVR